MTKLTKIVYTHTDVGGSQYIIDGKIKLKNDSQIQGFTTNGLKFEDGSEIETDVVVFCTGFVHSYYASYHSFLNLIGFFKIKTKKKIERHTRERSQSLWR